MSKSVVKSLLEFNAKRKNNVFFGMQNVKNSCQAQVMVISYGNTKKASIANFKKYSIPRSLSSLNIKFNKYNKFCKEIVEES